LKTKCQAAGRFEVVVIDDDDDDDTNEEEGGIMEDVRLRPDTIDS
jgi:hypothetical protein